LNQKPRASDVGRSYAYSGDGRAALLPGHSDQSPKSGGESSGAVTSGAGSPAWVDIVEALQADLVVIKQKMKELVQLHDARLKVGFKPEEEKEKERDVEIMTSEIAHQLKKCENGIKRIALAGKTEGVALVKEDRTVRLNVMRAFATQLQSLSQEFRQMQKHYMKSLQDQEERSSPYFPGDVDSKGPMSLDQAIDQGLTYEQLQQLKQMEAKATDREKEILHIAQSINDLAAMFRELHVLVIEQGTVLDRIDYQVEQTLIKVKEGVVELKEANRISKQARTLKCIIVLILLNIILGVGVYFRRR